MSEQSISIDNQIPSNPDAEKATLGAVLINPDIYYDLEDLLKPEDFYIVRHRWIWEAFVSLRKKSSPIDFLTVSEELERAGNLGECGGPAYLTGLLNQTPTSVHANAYALMVKACSVRRSTLTEINQIASQVYDEGVSIEELATNVQGMPDKIWEKLPDNNPPVAVEVAALSVLESLGKKADSVPISKDEAGMPCVDKFFGGIYRGKVMIVAAVTGLGKTTFIRQFAEGASLNGYKTLFVSTEMNGEDIIRRTACGWSNVPEAVLNSGKTTLQQNEAIQDFIREYQNLHAQKIFFDGRSHNPEMIIRNCRRLKPDLLILDHLDELDTDPKNKPVSTGRNYGMIRAYCREANIACACVLQLDLDVVNPMNPGARPNLEHLRWAKGDLSQQADFVVMLHRQDLVDARSTDRSVAEAALKSRDNPVPVEIWVRKNKYGSSDVCLHALFDLPRQRFIPTKKKTAQQPSQQLSMEPKELPEYLEE
jgi:replicative DNA helicase